MHKSLEKLKGKLCDELDEITRKEDLSAENRKIREALERCMTTVENVQS